MKFKLFSHFYFVRAILNSISQIMLIESPIVGVIFLIGIGLSSLTSLCAVLLGATVGSIMGKYLFKEPEKTVQGLYGYNAALSALAITVFSDTSLGLFYGVLSAGMTTYFQQIFSPWFEKNKLPIFTFPFVVISWGWISVIHHLHWDIQTEDLILQTQSIAQEVIFILTLPFHQIFFGTNPISGGLIIFGVLLADHKLFFKTFCFTLLCGGIWYLLGTYITFFHQGLFGFNAILAGIALTLFLPKVDFWEMMPFACLLCVWLQIVFTSILSVWQLPALTFPFVMTTWLVLWANRFK